MYRIGPSKYQYICVRTIVYYLCLFVSLVIEITVTEISLFTSSYKRNRLYIHIKMRCKNIECKVVKSHLMKGLIQWMLTVLIALMFCK